jgi:hypothetical protein
MGHAAAISAVAGDKEIAFEELQFGQQIGEGGFGKVSKGIARQLALLGAMSNSTISYSM